MKNRKDANFPDIKFKVDDGTVAAHKPLLMARCEMMYAMFNDNFIEASADMVSYVDLIVGVFVIKPALKSGQYISNT